MKNRLRSGPLLPGLLAAAFLPGSWAQAADSGDTQLTRTRHLVITTRLENNGECRSRSLSLTLTKERTQQTDAEPIVASRTLLEVSDFDWCSGSHKTISATWPNLNGSTFAKDLSASSSNVARNVTLSECSSSLEGTLSCSERTVRVEIATSLVPNGDYLVGGGVTISNTTGETITFTEKTKTIMADASYVVSIDGEAQSFVLAYGSLSSDLTKESL